MATIKQWLNKSGFDWANGKIIYQNCFEIRKDGSVYESPPGWGDPKKAELVDKDHKILTKKFDCGFGSPNCPRFIAEDENYFYFPQQYDGSTKIVKVYKNITKYLDVQNPTPYPGE